MKKQKYDVRMTLSLEGEAPVKSIKRAVIQRLNGARIRTDLRSNGKPKAVSVVKAVPRLVAQA